MTRPALFVTDLDGTLLDSRREFPEANLRAMREASEQGIALAVATGRRLASFREVSGELSGLLSFASLSNGAVLVGSDGLTPTAVHALPWEGALELEVVRAPGVIALLAVPAPAGPFEALPDIYVFRGGRAFGAKTAWDPSTHAEVSRASAMARPLVHVALHVAQRETAEALEDTARQAFAGHAVDIHTVMSPVGRGALLEVVVEGGKARAVRDVAALLSISPDRIGVLGDEMNDERMFEAADHRFAVGGSVLARRRPDAVEVATADDGAVADALRRFMQRLGR